MNVSKRFSKSGRKVKEGRSVDKTKGKGSFRATKGKGGSGA